MGKNKDILIEELAENFEDHIFERGEAYYYNRHVMNIKALAESEDACLIQGEVEGSDYYFCNFTFDLKKNYFKKFRCECPYDDNCKHLAALGLKFIDLYDEFLDKSNTKADDIAKFRTGLLRYINDGEIITAQPARHDIPRESSTPKIIDGEFEELGAEDLLRKTLEKIGIKTENLPKEIFISLTEELSKAKTTNAASMEKEDVKETSLPKFQPEKYKVVVEYDYTGQISIFKSQDIYHTISPSKFLKGFELSLEQREFFEFLRAYNVSDWQEKQKLDYGKLFLLIKKAGITAFRKDGPYSIQKFNFVDNPEKIKAELISEKRDNAYYEPQIKYNFIFKLGDEYIIRGYNNKKKFIVGEQYITYINGKDVSVHELPRNIMGIIARIISGNNYFREPLNKVTLNESELPQLNQMIEEGKKYLDLTTDLEPNYNIQKFDRADSCVIVDFDKDNALLEIKLAIDYGFTEQDVADSVYYARLKNENEFRRRDLKKYIMKIDDKNIFYAPLEEKKEIDLYKNFHGKEFTGFTKTLRCKRMGEEAIFLFFETHWPHMEKIAQENNYKIIFARDEFNFALGDFKADFSVDLNAANDWLWFDVNCYCGEDKIGLEDLKKYVNDKKGFCQMADGRMLKITNFDELERFIMMLESFYARENGGFEGKLYHATELEYIFTSSKYYNAKMEKSFKSFIKEAQSGKPVEKVKIPAKFNKILRAYQKEGINWFYFLRKYHFAGILADDMGLGKTLQSLVLLEMEKIKGKPSIVICPKTLLYNWKSETEKFTPDIRTLVVDGNSDERAEQIKGVKKYDLVITGYATMKKDSEIYKKNKIKFNYCILDEAQFIKNHATKNAQIVKKIDADYRLALTGTPLENSVSEIWSIFDFLMPGFLGSNRAFVKKFEKPIMKENNAAALENLKRKIECFMLRRTKKEVLKELPPKIEQISNCHLEPAQNILYQEILAAVKKDVFEAVKDKGFNKSRIHILAGLTKLRQVCNHPALLLKEKKYAKYESAKLNMFLELLDEIIGNNRKVLIFSQFTMMLDILAQELQKNKIKYNYLSGKTRARQEVVKDFNENENKKVFLISLKAGGTGLNLTAADNVIIFDPWWNPSVENQAIDRTHRIGQKNSVNVYRLITAGTIEEKIMKLKEKKKFLFDNLVGESKDLFNKLTWDDIKELFR